MTSTANRNCTACLAGYFCPNSTGEDYPCGNASLYSSTGSRACKSVDAGYYSVPESVSPTTRSGDLICPRGYACIQGVRLACQSGTYANAPGLSACRNCTVCRPGYEAAQACNATIDAKCEGE